jgi:hypothetical protein
VKSGDKRRGKRKPRQTPAGYFSLVETAAYLGVARETVIRWNRLRRGPPKTQINGLTLYRRTSLDAWLARHERDPEAETSSRRRRA